jgi:cytochrome c biogenesis protein CcmG/thiol:disulfide interchange protein DsbE
MAHDPRQKPEFRTPRWVWVLGFGLLAGALLLAIGLRATGGDAEAGLQGQAAPGFLLPEVSAQGPVTTRRGPQQSLGRPLLLHFWAPSCGPCVAELPRWQALWERGQREGFDVLTVAGDEASEVQAFLRDRHLTLAVVHDATGRVHGDYGVVGIPHTVAIDARGLVVRELSGARPPSQYEDALVQARK